MRSDSTIDKFPCKIHTTITTCNVRRVIDFCFIPIDTSSRVLRFPISLGIHDLDHTEVVITRYSLVKICRDFRPKTMYTIYIVDIMVTKLTKLTESQRKLKLKFFPRWSRRRSIKLVISTDSDS